MEISERHRLAWMEQFLHSSQIGILVVDKQRNILFANQYFCSIFGYHPNEILHASTEMFHISHESFVEFSRQAFRYVQEGKPVNIDYPCKHKNGKTVWIHISGDLISNHNEVLWTIVDITKRVEAEREIVRFKERVDLALEANRDVVWDWNLITDELYVSPRWKEIIGYDSSETPYEIKIWRRYLHPEDRKKLFKDINNVIAGKQEYLDNIHRIRHHDGHWIWIHIRGKILFDHDGKAVRMTGTHRNITERKKLQLKITQQAQIIEQIHDSVISIDLNGNILTWNRGSEVLLDYSSAEAVGQHITMIFHKEDYEKVYQNIEILKRKGEFHIEVRLFKKSHTTIIADLSASLLKDEKGEVIGMIGYIQDITERKKAQNALLQQKEILHYQANHDTLTSLPNRLLFQNRLRESIYRAKRNHKKIALFFIDLDHFKEINDSLGHDIGDEVLKAVSTKLKNTIRETDTLARLGGDEFTIILENLMHSRDASLCAKKIIDALSSVMKIREHELYVSSSIGISMYPDDGTSEYDLLKYADAAMYRAKEEGRNNFQFYSSEMTEMAYEKVKIEAELRDGLKNNEFVVYYQPQLDGVKNRLIGIEALVRWTHPVKGFLLAGKFIDLARSTGLIVELDRFVMKTAMLQIVQWYEQKLNPGRLALNISVNQLYKNEFIGEFQQMMAETGCKAQWLELEITEDQMMKDPDKALKILHQLSKMGITLTIDDFGLGYSSFAYLQKLPIGKLKIDRTFIRNIPQDQNNVAIVKSIIGLAKNLNLDLIAEGIRNREQKEFIIQNGCKKIQGYYYAKALSCKEMEQFLKQ